MTLHKWIVAIALFLGATPCMADMIITNAPHGAAGGGSPTGSVFVASGTARQINAVDDGKFTFRSLPTTGNGVVIGLGFTGTALPTSVKNNDNVSLTIATSIIKAADSIGTVIYYEQSITVGSTYYVTVNWGGSPPQYLGNIVEFTSQNNPALDVSTGGVRNAAIVSSTSPVTAATTQLGFAVAVSNSVSSSFTCTPLPAGWVEIAGFTDGSVTELGCVSYRSGAGLAGVNANSRFTTNDGTRMTQSVSYFK